MGDECLVDLQPDRQDRVQRRHRLLEDHGDLGAAHRFETRRRQREEVLAAPEYRAAYRRALMEEAGDRAQSDALAGSGLPDEAENLSLPHIEIDTVDGAKPTARRLEGDLEVAHAKQRCRRDYHRFTSRRSARPSPVRLNPSPHTTTARPGKKHIHGACVKKFFPSATITPHSAVGGCAPSPR